MSEHTPSPQSVVVPVDAEMPLPCPFCGCKVAEAGFWFARADTPPMAYVFCLECSDTITTDGPKRETLEEAIAAWNRRAAPAPSSLAGGEVQGAIDRLRKAVAAVRPVNVLEAARLTHVDDDETATGLFSVPKAHTAYADLLWHATHDLPIVLAALSPEAPAREKVSTPARPVHIVRVSGATLDEQKAVVRQSETYQRGDTVLCWVNEGDLYANPSVVFEDLTALTPRPEAPAEGAGE